MTSEITIIENAITQYRMKGLSFSMEDIAIDMHIAKKTIFKFFPY